MSNNTNQSPTQRAEAMLTRWGQRLSPGGQPASREPAAPTDAPPARPPAPPEEQADTAQRADRLLSRLAHRMSGQGLVEAAAYGYVALAIRTGRVADSVQKTWQENVEAARTQQIQQAQRTEGKDAGRRAATDERTGENILKGVEKDVAQDAAKDVEAAASAAV